MQRLETKARARALQLLHAWELSGEPPWAVLMARAAAAYGPPDAAFNRAVELAERGVAGHVEFDRRIAVAAEHWRLERLGIVEKNILRLALAELGEGVTPPRVVIDEAVKLAHWFAGEGGPAFVNGLLDRLARDTGRL